MVARQAMLGDFLSQSICVGVAWSESPSLFWLYVERLRLAGRNILFMSEALNNFIACLCVLFLPQE
jgi:hypothetical protein